eukprot:GSA25T00025926001.1
MKQLPGKGHSHFNAQALPVLLSFGTLSHKKRSRELLFFDERLFRKLLAAVDVENSRVHPKGWLPLLEMLVKLGESSRVRAEQYYTPDRHHLPRPEMRGKYRKTVRGFVWSPTVAKAKDLHTEDVVRTRSSRTSRHNSIKSKAGGPMDPLEVHYRFVTVLHRVARRVCSRLYDSSMSDDRNVTAEQEGASSDLSTTLSSSQLTDAGNFIHDGSSLAIASLLSTSSSTALSTTTPQQLLQTATPPSSLASLVTLVSNLAALRVRHAGPLLDRVAAECDYAYDMLSEDDMG